MGFLAIGPVILFVRILTAFVSFFSIFRDTDKLK